MMNRYKDNSKSTDCSRSLDSVLDGLNALRKELTFCDITLTAGERKFRVHKNIISANCGLFRTMFSGICWETDEIPIDRIDPDCLELLIEFMYTGSLILDSNNAEEFLLAASFLQMEKLEEFCEQFLERKSGCFSFPKTAHASYLLNCLSEFRKNGTFCDVTVKVGERTFPVHKNMMSSVSLFFKNVCLETEEEEICLNEVDADILESLIDYMYTGILRIDLNNVKTILLLNVRLQILNVNKLCCDFILDKLEVETFAEYWDFSSEHIKDVIDGVAYNLYVLENNSVECLRDSLMEKAVATFPVLCPKIEFEFEEIKHIIEALQEKGTPEDLLFSFLMRWINHSEVSRVKYTKDLLELLQPSLISPNLFRSLEIVNASNPMFTSWANQSHSYLFPNDLSEYILMYPCYDKVNSLWRINLFSETEDIGIDFPQPIRRCGTFVCHGYYIYYQAGQTKCDVVAETHVYHPTKRVWTPFVPLLEARYVHSSCVINQKIFSVGGRNVKEYLSSVEFTDILTGQQAFTDPMPSSKLLFGLAVHENSMYVIGGYSSDTHRFDIREGVWQSLPPFPSHQMLNSCGVVGESIYLSKKNTLYRYDIRANQWESIVTQGECLISGNVFSVNNTLYGLSEDCIGRYIPEERRWVKQRTWTNKKIGIFVWNVATNLLNPVI